MVLEAALVNDKVNLIGWDVAISKNGPVIIEGNRGPGFDLVQVLLKHGAKYMLTDLLKSVKQGELIEEEKEDKIKKKENKGKKQNKNDKKVTTV